MSDLSYTADNLRYSPQYIENKLKFSSYIAEAAVIGSGKIFVCYNMYKIFSIVRWAENKELDLLLIQTWLQKKK